MILVNGAIHQHISVSDRGFQYGDGLFETIAVLNTCPVAFDRHLKRLKDGCKRLLIPFPGEEILLSEAQTLIAEQPTPAVLKIIITRGSGGRGYRQPDPINATRVLSLHPYPDYPISYQEHGITARFCETRLGLNPLLAGLKHLNRLEQVLARAEWNDGSIQEGLMLDINDQVIEGTMSNLFYIKSHTLYTPPLTLSGIAGIMRGIIIQLATHEGLSVIEQPTTKAELLVADELFVCNSIIGIWPIKKLDEHDHFRCGSVTKHLQTLLNHFRNEGNLNVF